MTLELVGPAEIAERLGVQRETVHQWRHREIMPEPGWTISGVPIWEWSVILEWAQATGRG